MIRPGPKHWRLRRARARAILRVMTLSAGANLAEIAALVGDPGRDLGEVRACA